MKWDVTNKKNKWEMRKSYIHKMDFHKGCFDDTRYLCNACRYNYQLPMKLSEITKYIFDAHQVGRHITSVRHLKNLEKYNKFLDYENQKEQDKKDNQWIVDAINEKSKI